MVQQLMYNMLRFKNQQSRFKSYGLKRMYKNKGKDISFNIILEAIHPKIIIYNLN